MGPYPRPHFFISRPDHSITPLIAVDELPDYVRIDGVPPVMTQADTQAMMSLGVKERSLGQYDVQVVKYSGSSSYEEPAESCNTSASGIASDDLGQAQPLSSTEKQTRQMEDNTADSSSIEIVQRPDLDTGKQMAAVASEAAQGGVEGKKTADIEEWRQEINVGPVDEIQAAIDNLVATRPKADEKAKKDLNDENPRAAQSKAGLTPGKKVYCSHWIRTGECDFTQQGCLYKHEMPDDDTLKAIGIRSLPAWYVAANPGKARERGYSREYASNSHTSKPHLNLFQGSPSSFTSARGRSMIHPPAFGFPKVSNATFFYPPAGFAQGFVRTPFLSDLQQHGPSRRFQEITDDRSSVWPNAHRSRAGQLQLLAKPAKLKSPGYNTFPYPPPAPPAAQPPPTSRPPPSAQPPIQSPTRAKPQINPLPVWEPRQPKYTNPLIHGKEQSDSNRTRDASVEPPIQATSHVKQEEINPSHGGPSLSIAQVLQPSVIVNEPNDPCQSQSSTHAESSATPPESRGPAINNLYAPLKPSTAFETVAADPPSLRRKPSNSSDLFALAPKVPSPRHPRLFVRHSEERFPVAATEPEALQQGTKEIRENAGAAEPKEMAKKTYRKQRQAPSAPESERPYSRVDSEKRKILSPEKHLRTKRIERERGQASERLVDY